MFSPRNLIIAGVVLIAISLGPSGHGLWWLVGFLWLLPHAVAAQPHLRAGLPRATRPRPTDDARSRRPARPGPRPPRGLSRPLTRVGDDGGMTTPAAARRAPRERPRRLAADARPLPRRRRPARRSCSRALPAGASSVPSSSTPTPSPRAGSPPASRPRMPCGRRPCATPCPSTRPSLPSGRSASRGAGPLRRVHDREGQGRRAWADPRRRRRPCRRRPVRDGAVARVRVDANGGWDVETATEALRRLTAYDLEYAEQPCATVEELIELRTALAREGIDVPHCGR